jgi:hypothetical protein
MGFSAPNVGGTVEISEITTLADGTIIIGDGSGTTDVYAQFISAVEDLSTVTASTGDIYLETVLLP